MMAILPRIHSVNRVAEWNAIIVRMYMKLYTHTHIYIYIYKYQYTWAHYNYTLSSRLGR